MKKLVFIALLCVCVCRVFANFASTDDRLKLPREDTAKINALNKLAREDNYKGYYMQADSLAREALRLAEKFNYKKGQADAYNNIGNTYYGWGNYADAMTSYITSLKIKEAINDRKGMAPTYSNMGLVYWHQKDYTNALTHLDTALKIDIEMDNKDNMASVYGNISIVYFSLRNYPEAIKNLTLGLNINKQLNNNDGIAIACSNLGELYMYQQNYSAAEKDYYTALALYRGENNKHGMSTVFANLGNLFTTEKKYAIAKKYLDSALAIAAAAGSKEVMIDTYASLAELDSATGMYKAAYSDYRRSTIYKLSVDNAENTKRIVSEQMNAEFDKKMTIEKANDEEKEILHSAESTRKSIIAYSAIIILILTFISAWLLINRQQIKNKRDKAIHEREMKLLLLEKQRMEDELANAKKMLDEYIKTMIEKNALLEQFKADIEELKQGGDEKKMERLEHLNKITILTDGDWNKFKQLFEQVYKGFLKRLQEKLPDLTQSEVRLICLTKLQLGTKQMAEILAVSSGTILTSRYRLRKKLGLPEESNIDSVIESI